MSDERYEIRMQKSSSTTRFWDGSFRVFDKQYQRFVSIGFRRMDDAERCRHGLIRDDAKQLSASSDEERLPSPFAPQCSDSASAQPPVQQAADAPAAVSPIPSDSFEPHLNYSR